MITPDDIKRTIEAGLACERLSPIEADGEHVLAAVAMQRAQSPAHTSVA